MRTDQEITQEILNHGKREWWRYVAMFVTVVFIAGAAVVISISAARRSAQRDRDRDRSALCALVIVQDDAYRTPPGPQTPVGRATAKALADLRRAYRCDERK